MTWSGLCDSLPACSKLIRHVYSAETLAMVSHFLIRANASYTTRLQLVATVCACRMPTIHQSMPPYNLAPCTCTLRPPALLATVPSSADRGMRQRTMHECLLRNGTRQHLGTERGVCAGAAAREAGDAHTVRTRPFFLCPSSAGARVAMQGRQKWRHDFAPCVADIGVRIVIARRCQRHDICFSRCH